MTLQEWKLPVHPENLRHGLGKSTEVCNAIKTWLQEIMNADLIHAQPAQQAYAFSLALLVAVPFAKPHRPEAQHGLPAQARAARRGWFARLCSITPCQM